MQPLSVSNQLFIPPKPEELKLNQLESNITAQRKLYAEVDRMPRDQTCLKASVENIHLPVDEVATLLKKVDMVRLLMLKYTRKLEFRSDDAHSVVDIERNMKAVRKLVKINMLQKFQDIGEFSLS